MDELPTMPGATLSTFDPIAVEIHRKAIENLASEMALTLIRTSGSPVVTSGRDFCTCIMDEQGEQLGISAYVLLHSASSLLSTRAVRNQLAANGETPRPGDGWIVNDPHTGGALHQGDVSIVMPIFFENEHVAWGSATMHVLDIGGGGVSGFAPAARTMYEEALRFPPTKVIEGGMLVSTWEGFIAANVRAPEAVINDIRSMIAANNVAAAKLTEIINEYGLERHRAYSELNKNLTEQLFRDRISKIPNGSYHTTEWVEFDGHGDDLLLEVNLRLDVEDRDLRLNFSGAPQIEAFVNATTAAVYGQSMSTIRLTLGYGDLPFNAGMWRPLHFDLGVPGTIVNAVEPAPVTAAHAETGKRVGKAVKDVLSQALALSEDPILRGRVAGQPQDAQPIAGLFGLNQRGQRVVVFNVDTATGSGGGAQTTGDGMDCYGASNQVGCGLTDIEVHEADHPVLYLWRTVAKNSGGPGRYRGGQAVEQAYLLNGSDELRGWAFNVCAEVPPVGAAGGFSASAGAMYPITANNVDQLLAGGQQPLAEIIEGDRVVLPNKVGSFTVNRGDVMVFRSGGGGGVGDPLLRDPAAVISDVRNGYISAVNARFAYGVVVADEGVEGNGHDTDALRAEMRQARLGQAPTRDQAVEKNAGVAVTRNEVGDGWCCGYCGLELTSGISDWASSDAVKVREEPIEDRYGRLDMGVRGRHEEPHVVIRDLYCTACAGCLKSTVVVTEKELASS
jgi:N-methylhydantoinase B